MDTLRARSGRKFVPEGPGGVTGVIGSTGLVLPCPGAGLRPSRHVSRLSFNPAASIYLVQTFDTRPLDIPVLPSFS
jgi:hypothetical protein